MEKFIKQVSEQLEGIRDSDASIGEIFKGLGMGGVLVVAAIGVLLLIGTGPLFLLLLVVGGALVLLSGAAGVGKAAVSKPGQQTMQAAHAAAKSLDKEAERKRLRGRAGRVVAQMKDQHDAGAISKAEYDERVERVNEKLALDLAEVDGR